MNQKQKLMHRHLVFGWWSLAAFVALGIFLEALWSMRLDWYVAEPAALRRLLWRLGHAHGTMFSLIHIAYALCVGRADSGIAGSRIVSACLMSASVLMPGGFFLGGMFLYGNGGDPGLGIFLAPIGAMAMLIAVFMTAVQVTRSVPQEHSDDD